MKNFKITRKLNEENAITLVALTVTIIILIILSVISIAVLKQVGLFDKANQAKQKSENAQKEENVILSEYENKIDEIVKQGSRNSQEISLVYRKDFKFNEENVDVEKSKLTLVQYGKVTTITGTITLSSTSYGGQYLYLENLPRPVSKMYFVVTDENAQKINILIDKDGKMYNYWSGLTINQGKEIRLSMTYISE